MSAAQHTLFHRPLARQEPSSVASPTRTDEAIMRSLGRYTYLTVEQLDKTLRIFLPGSKRGLGKDPLRYLQERCLWLLENGYLYNRNLATVIPEKPPRMFWLADKGKT